VANDSSVAFLDVAAHELRTWVTIIYGGVNLLKNRLEAMDEESRLALMRDIEGASEKLRQAVEGMLLLARLEAGRGPATGPLLLQETLPQIAVAFTQLRPSRPVRPEVEDLDAVLGVPSYLEYILRTLLIDVDDLASAGAPISLRGARDPALEAVVSVLAPVGQDLRTQLLMAEYGGLEEEAHRRHVAPLVVRRLVEAQSGRTAAGLPGEGLVEISFTLPFAEPRNRRSDWASTSL
jgi:K+-sensing histidine kinase KdpD